MYQDNINRYASILVMLFGLTHLTLGFAITTRHDMDDANYIVAAANYPALVTLFEPHDCTAILVHPSHLLTVAHCTNDLNISDQLTINERHHRITRVIKHPNWKSWRDEFDIALIRLAQPVKDVKPLPIYRDNNELGSLITLVGHGMHASGLQGESKADNDGQLRRATNRVSAVNDHFIEIIFEHPGESGITSLEGIGIAGDSGCPAFIDINNVPHIAGLNAYGEESDDAIIGQYGTRDYQTRISQYLGWLDSLINLPTPH